MSYLDYPRIHFSGKFQAAPGTINNTPNNYSTSNYVNGLQRKPESVEVYWNPNGNGVFNLLDCVVTRVVYGPGDETGDPEVEPLINQPVSAAYTKAPPKIVDLDPDQQNVSEIWGLTMQVAGLDPGSESIRNFIRGDFAEVCYHNIWAQATDGPHSSASGAGAYQSLLTNLAFDVDSAPGSRGLGLLASRSPDQVSVLFTVNSHNNSPPIYRFNQETFTKMGGLGVPDTVLDKIAPLKQIIQNVGSTPGDVPTQAYVNYLLNRMLSTTEVTSYLSIITEATEQPYDNEGMPTDFTFGYVTGSIGPQEQPAPVHLSAVRMMGPVTQSQSGIKVTCNYAPFQTVKSDTGVIVTVDLSNALLTRKPGFLPATELLGGLELVYFDQAAQTRIGLDNAVVLAEIKASDSTLMHSAGGVIDIVVNGEESLLAMPMGIVGRGSRPPGEGSATDIIWLAENIEGYFMQADQFVYRMNPELPAGSQAFANIYVTKFGGPAENVEVSIAKMTPAGAVKYTNNTLGTSGTRGIKNVSTPESALLLCNASGQQASSVYTDAQGVARVIMKASDPGRPREDQGLDGQVYFLTYGFADQSIARNYTKSADSVISVQVYSAPTSIPQPTWKNCIQSILAQYGALYPVMGSLQLWDYDSVKGNSQMIKTVFEKPFADALHMPVVRDLSETRRKTILQWIAADCPLGTSPE